jgi:hypothetical protein
MKLPADSQEWTVWAQVALAAFMAETGTPESDALAEFLTNAMHSCARSGESFEAQLERARSLYREETRATEMACRQNRGLRPHA